MILGGEDGERGERKRVEEGRGRGGGRSEGEGRGGVRKRHERYFYKIGTIHWTS